MKFRILGLAIVTAITPLAAHAGQNPPAATSIPLAQEAETFARLFLPGDRSAEGAKANYIIQFKRGWDANPENGEMARRYPGLYEAALEAGLASLNAVFSEMVPKAHSRIAKVAADRLSLADLQGINAFYRSATGQAVLGAVVSSLDMNALADKMAAQETPNLQMDDMTSALGTGYVAKLTAGQQREFVRFMISPAGRNLRKALPEINTAMFAEINASLAKLNEDQMEAIGVATMAHISTIEKAKTAQ